MENTKLQLLPCEQKHLPVLMTWVKTESQCQQWGGPFFRYPFDARSFAEDCSWRELPSFVVQDSGGELLAFGQYYARLDRCHLSRLIVAPAARGRGIGKGLIKQLALRGCCDLKLDQCSLFVLKENLAAQVLYEKLGFQQMEYPEPFDGLELCYYMAAAAKEMLEMEV
ncbi:GNAT family N-acetyltransferase [Microbulbifer bruguierae]|uniref:GNAT family N-acetyltransferase n=1 Tax=Microbulbifer bruguierae TaxID=3029061 RepID=A0ABY8N9P4_9GAMM|nr:GNAT family N-acetyltransferase [Microbulbifer bruguierae]WGL15159.1 GNAT family N-acetyltransferase [Microbulbifer bruguierae]